MFGAVTLEELDARYLGKAVNTVINMVEDWTVDPEAPVLKLNEVHLLEGIARNYHAIITGFIPEHTHSWEHDSSGTDSSPSVYDPDKWDKTLDTWFLTDEPTFTETLRNTLFWTFADEGTYTSTEMISWTAWVELQETITTRPTDTFTLTLTSWDLDVGGDVATGTDIWVEGETDGYYSWESWDTWSENILPQNALESRTIVTDTDITINVPVTFVEAITYTGDTFIRMTSMPATTHRETLGTTAWFTDGLTFEETLWTDLYGETWYENQFGNTIGRGWTTQLRELPDYQGADALPKKAYDPVNSDVIWETIWNIPEEY